MRPARDLLGQPALPRLPGAVEDNHGPVGKGIKQIVSDVARVHAISVVLAGRRIKRQLADYPPTAGGLSDSRHLVSPCCAGEAQPMPDCCEVETWTRIPSGHRFDPPTQEVRKGPH